MDACVICTRLHTCSDVTETRVLSGPLCPLVIQAPDAAISARLRVLDDFGPVYLLHLKDHPPMTPTQEEDLRSPLRQIATTLGLVPGGVVGFRIKYAEYIEKLRPQFPEIGTLSDNNTLSVSYLNNILNGLKGGANVSAAEPVAQAPVPQRTPVTQQATPDVVQTAAADAPGKRKPGRKPRGAEDTQAAPQVVAEPEPVVVAPVTTPVVQQQAPQQAQTAAPVRRAPGGFRKPGDAPGSQQVVAPAPVVDLNGLDVQFADLRARIDYLGAASDEHTKSIKAFKDVVTDFENLEARFENLIVAVTWMYNQFVEGDEVDSIEEIEFEGG